MREAVLKTREREDERHSEHMAVSRRTARRVRELTETMKPVGSIAAKASNGEGRALLWKVAVFLLASQILGNLSPEMLRELVKLFTTQ